MAEQADETTITPAEDTPDPEDKEQEGEAGATGEQQPPSGAAGSKAANKKKKKKEKKKGGAGQDEPQVLTARNLQEILTKLSVEDQTKGHEFWDTQPVPKLNDEVTDTGAIEVDKGSVRTEAYSLPAQFMWDNVDLQDERQLSELYQLLNENYVEDDDNMFRFDYSCEFLHWALQPPGWKKQWHCGVRVVANKKLVGFISAVPAKIKARDHKQLMVEINFLCVHKKLRSKRVAPVLIKEITRRVNMEGIFQAVYTAGVVLPKPIAACRYWHRSLNPKKLVEVQFSSLHRHMTLQRMMRLYRLPDETKTPGLRPMEPRDVTVVLRLLNEYLDQYSLAPVFTSEEEVAHWFLPKADVVNTYVVEDPVDHVVTDLLSLYHLPSSVVRHPVHKTLRASYSFYNVANSLPLKDLMFDALILAKKAGADVFNALDIMDNNKILEELKFGVGDGNLHYYLYNWKCPSMPPTDVALVLQ